MSFATKPTFILQPFANNGLKNSIPNVTNSNGYASYDQGFPEITMQPKESGGLPPRGQDMNGILNNGGSKFDIYHQMGGTYPLSTDILSNGGYAKNSVVYQDDGVYRSMVDNNTDNFITTPSVIGSTWQLLIDYISEAGSNGVPLQMSYFARTDVPTGWLRCDGTQYNRASFPNFYDDYLVTGKAPTLSYTDYNLEVADNGSCGSFALDEVNLTFKTPTITGSTFIAQALASGDIAKFVSAGLPNITGKIDTAITGSAQNESGALKRGVVTGNLMGAGSYNNYDLEFDASGSSAIYGNSDTVTPAHIKYPLFVCVSNVAVPASEAEYNAFIDGLTNKVDLDGTNATFSNLSNTARNNLFRYNKSPDYTVAAGAVVIYNHNLGLDLYACIVQIIFTCTSPDLNYSIGDTVVMPIVAGSSTNLFRPITINSGENTHTIIYPNQNPLLVVNKTNGIGSTLPNPAKWKMNIITLY